MKNYVLISLFLLCGMVGFTSCVYTPIKGYNGNSKIDPQYLDFWYRQQILPAYAGYLSQVKRLDEMAGELEKYPEKLVELKRQYEAAFLSLQDLIIFDQPYFVGELYGLYAVSARFPVNKTQLEDAVWNRYSAEDLSERLDRGVLSPNALGYAALDYLLYSDRVDLTGETGREYLSFFPVLTRLLVKQAEAVYTSYEKGGDNFVRNDDFSVGGSLNVVPNLLMSNFEAHIRTAKVGIPVGIYGVSVHQPEPMTVEAYYHGEGLSTRLLLRSVQAFQRFYDGYPYGASSAKNGALSFATMLGEYLPPSKRTEILQKMEQVFTALHAELDDETADLARLAETPEGTEKLKRVYAELQKVVGILKTEVVSALGLTVTYSDGEEGD